MQDKQTGDMVMIGSDNEKYLKSVDVAVTDSDGTLNVQETTKRAQAMGCCVLSEGEIVNICGGNFKIKTMGKKEVLLECPEDVGQYPIPTGGKITVKNGDFTVMNCGPKFMKIRGLAGNMVLNQNIVDEYHKRQLEAVRKEK